MNEQEDAGRERIEGEAAGTVKVPPLWRRTRPKLIVLGVGLFICGFFAGSAATMGVVYHKARRVVRNPEELARKVLEHWGDHLDLTEEQADEALRILTKKHVAFVRAMRRSFDEAHDEIRAILTEEQATRWDKDMQKRRDHIFGRGARE